MMPYFQSWLPAPRWQELAITPMRLHLLLHSFQESGIDIVECYLRPWSAAPSGSPRRAGRSRVIIWGHPSILVCPTACSDAG